MPVNLELKIAMHSFEGIEKLLAENNIKKEKLVKQKDIYYKNKNSLLKLRIENRKNFLIKYNRDEKRKRWSDYQILELKGENVGNYLSQIFTVTAIVEKTRKLYLYKDTRIHLDIVKKLGKFLELETVVTNNKQKAEREFNEVIALLKLDTSKQIRAAYRDLLLTKYK